MRVIALKPVDRRTFARWIGMGSVGLGLTGNLFAQKSVQGQLPPEYETEPFYPKFPDNVTPLKLDQPLVYAIWRYIGAVYYFEPVGLYVEPGETVGFVIGGSSGRTPTITAYHPDNDNHELRIPENAVPFDSGDPPRGRRSAPSFSHRFEVEGTYDYFSKWEEWRGMVGRVVVGKPGGPGEKPWGYGNKVGRRVIPPEVMKRVQAGLLNSEEIVRKKAIEFPFQNFFTRYPQW